MPKQTTVRNVLPMTWIASYYEVFKPTFGDRELSQEQLNEMFACPINTNVGRDIAAIVDLAQSMLTVGLWELEQAEAIKAHVVEQAVVWYFG